MALAEAQRQADAVTTALGGYGIFGVELFIKGDMVWFSEVSPRPHDTGMVTMIAQNLSQFELHVRAILGLPVFEINNLAPSASHVILADKADDGVSFEGVDDALKGVNQQAAFVRQNLFTSWQAYGGCTCSGCYYR